LQQENNFQKSFSGNT